MLLLELLATLLVPPGVLRPEEGTFGVIAVGVDAVEEEDDGPPGGAPTVAALPLVFVVVGPAALTATLVFRLVVALAGAIDPRLFLRLWRTEAGILLGWFMLAGGTVACVDVLLKRW